jgi:hypothetical protein
MSNFIKQKLKYAMPFRNHIIIFAKYVKNKTICYLRITENDSQNNLIWVQKNLIHTNLMWYFQKWALQKWQCQNLFVDTF